MALRLTNNNRIALAMYAWRELARRHLLRFINYTFQNYKSNWFHEDVCSRLEKFYDDVQAKRSPRLMLFAPPRHGKSEMVSRRFPAWALGKDPDLSIISTSYSASLSSRLNRDTQRIIDSNEYRGIFPNTILPDPSMKGYSRNNEIFEIINHKGVYRSAGVGVGITGMGAKILIIDDPIKDAAEAMSATIRESTWEWYISTAYSRLEPGGGVLLIMTRWNTDDVAGRLLNKMQAGGDQWEVVSYPAICENDELHRCKGEPLYSERYSIEKLNGIKAAVGSRFWAALYQQDPKNVEGGLFKRTWFEIVPAAPAQGRRIRYWDRAATEATGENDPDYTAGVKMCKAPDGYFYIEDVSRFRGSPKTVKDTIRNVATQDGRDCEIGIEQDPGQAGVAEAQDQVRNLSGFNARLYPVTKSKEIRAMPLSAQAEAGNVKIVRGFWNETLLDECEVFPNGPHDDQVDGASGAFNRLNEGVGFTGILPVTGKTH